MADLLSELARLTDALEDHGIEYAVCGGLALTILGFPRATFDIDILIRKESLERCFEIAKPFGFDIHGMAMSMVSRTGLIKMKELAGRPKDLIDIDRIKNERD
jgi:hypothetical protein